MVYHPGGVHPETKLPMPGGWIEETELFEAPCDIDDLAWFAGEEAWQSGVRLLGMPQWICSQSTDVPPGALAETEGYPGGCAADCGPWGQCVLRCNRKGIPLAAGTTGIEYQDADFACNADALVAMALAPDDGASHRDVVTSAGCGCRQQKDDQFGLIGCSKG